MAQHFSRMPSRRSGDVQAAKHACDFLDPLPGIERGHLAQGLSSPFRLRDLPLPVRTGRDLRQMGDTQNLAVASQSMEEFAYDFRHPPADPDIDLVENERGCSRVATGQNLNRESDA